MAWSRTCDPAARCWHLGSSRTARRTSPAAFRARGLDDREPLDRGRVGRARAAPHGLSGPAARGVEPGRCATIWLRCPTCRRCSPSILATHITLAICLLVPSLLLPFTLRNRSVAPNAAPDQPGRVVRCLSWAQTHGTIVIGAGLALTGIGDDRRARPADAPAAVAAGQPGHVRRRRRGRVRGPAAAAATPAGPRRHPDRRGPRRVAGPRATPAVRRVRARRRPSG